MGDTELGAFALDPDNDNRWILTGEIDISVHERFREVWPLGRQATAPIEIDMGAVTFIDSSGLRILYDARTAFAGDDLPILTDVPERVRWIIEVTGLTALFTFAEAVSEA